MMCGGRQLIGCWNGNNNVIFQLQWAGNEMASDQNLLLKKGLGQRFTKQCRQMGVQHLAGWVKVTPDLVKVVKAGVKRA